MPQTLIPNIHHFIGQVDPFDKLPDELQRQIACAIKITYLGKGEQVHFGAEVDARYLYVIRTGSMEQRNLDGGLRAKLGPEDIFGFTFLDPSKEDHQDYMATAIENTLLYLVPHEELQLLLEQYPKFSEYFAANAQVRLHSALDVQWSDSEKGLFVKKVAEVASKRVAVVDANTSIQQTADEMRRICRTSCAVIKQDDEIVGLVTDRDMTKRVVAQGIDIQLPISHIMTLEPLTIGPDDLVLQASVLMMQHNVRSLPVVEDNQVLGILTTTHLVKNNRMQAMFLIERIKYSETAQELAQLAPERQAIFEALVEGGVSAEVIGHVMTMIMDAYSRRLLQMAEHKLGPAPCEFAWMVAGSHARNEVHLLSDQDCAIVLPDGTSETDRQYFLHLAHWVCNGLAACGYPLCPGKYMAANPKWCQPKQVWLAYYSKWVASPEYDKLLNISVFLETRCIYGNEALVSALHQHLLDEIAASSRFLPSLVRDSVTVSPPLGIFNYLVLEKGGEHSNTLNIKKYAITLLVDLARIYGLSAQCHQDGTEARFRHAHQHGLLSEEMLKNVLGAYGFISQVRFKHQLAALKAGNQADNHIAPDQFGSFERKHLKDAFRIINDLQEVAKIRFTKD